MLELSRSQFACGFAAKKRAFALTGEIQLLL